MASGTDICADCASYGVWYDQVARRPAVEITGEISVEDLLATIQMNELGHVRLVLHAAEGGGGLMRYLGRGPDLLPNIQAAQVDRAGIGFDYIDRNGNTGSVYRPHRMRLEVIIDSQPVLVVRREDSVDDD